MRYFSAIGGSENASRSEELSEEVGGGPRKDVPPRPPEALRASRLGRLVLFESRRAYEDGELGPFDRSRGVLGGEKPVLSAARARRGNQLLETGVYGRTSALLIIVGMSPQASQEERRLRARTAQVESTSREGKVDRARTTEVRGT